MSAMIQPYPSLSGSSGSAVGRTMTGAARMPSSKIPKGYKSGSINRFTPEQMQVWSSLFSHTLPESQLSRLASGEEIGFEPQEEMAQRDFQEALGGIASRFSGMGSGARGSSAFQHATSQAAQDFATRLKGERRALQRDALEDLMNLSQMLLTQSPQENFLIRRRQKKPSFLSQIGRGLVGGFGQGLSGFSGMIGL